MPDPIVEVVTLIDREFDYTNTALGSRPEIHTGTWDRDQRLPAVAVPSSTDSIITPGETEATAYDGEGGFYQRHAAEVTVQCVAGTRDDLRGAGPNGENLNPKQIRAQLQQEVYRIAKNYRTTNLRTVLPAGYQDIARGSQADDVKPVLARQVTLTTTYDYRD